MRVRRSLLNFGTSVLYLVVTTGVALFATPLLLKALGKAPFGAFPVVLTGYGFLGILEFGLGGVLVSLFVQALAADDEFAVRRTAAAGIRAYVKVSLVVIAIGLAVTPFVHLADAKITPSLRADLRVAWVLGLASFLTLAFAPLRNLVDARQRGYVINATLTVQSLVITGLSLVLARCADCGLIGQSLAYVTGVWIFTIIMTAVASWSHPGLLCAAIVEPVDDETRAALRGLSTPALWFGVCGRVGFMTDNLVISRILGFESVAGFLNTQKLAVLGQTVLLAIGNAGWLLADLHARGERELFNRRLIEMTRLVAILGAVGFVPIVAFNRVFFALWMKKTDLAYGGDFVVAIAVLNAVVFAEHSLWGWCFAAAGKIRELLPLSVIATALNLVASILFTYRFGLIGPLLGTTFAFALVGIWLMVWRLNRTFGTPVASLLAAVGWPLAVGASAAAGLWWWSFGHEPTSWLGLVLTMSASGCVMLIGSWFVLLIPDERAHWRHRLSGFPIFRARVPSEVLK